MKSSIKQILFLNTSQSSMLNSKYWRGLNQQFPESECMKRGKVTECHAIDHYRKELLTEMKQCPIRRDHDGKPYIVFRGNIIYVTCTADGTMQEPDITITPQIQSYRHYFA